MRKPRTDGRSRARNRAGKQTENQTGRRPGKEVRLPPVAPLALPRPRYAERFACIGPTFADSCCKAWDLQLDRATYARYQLIPAESLLGRKVRQSVVELPEPRSEGQYGRILLNEALDCPFLSREKWCEIQLELGEEALSQTCRTYPRIEQRTPDGRVETTLHLSCPEAARLILLDDDPMREQPAAEAYAAVVQRCGSGMAAARQDAAMPEIVLGATREFLLLLLRDRRYSLGERMLLMGLFAGRLGAALGVGWSEAGRRFPALMREFCVLVGEGMPRSMLGRVAGEPAMQLALTLGVVNRRLDRVMNSMGFLDGVKQFLDGVGYRPGRTPESLAPALLRAEREWFEPWMEANPQVLENYLVHAVYRSLFPLGKDWRQADPEAIFRELCTHFVVIRTLLTGMAGKFGAEFTREQGVRMMQAYGRMVDHHAEFLQVAAGLLKTVGWADEGSVARLLLEGVRRRQAESAIG